MRTTKFRVWDHRKNKFYFFDLLSLIGGVDPICVAIKMGVVTDFQQFSGLIDKNGKEIYEGDIILYEHPYAGTWKDVVEYDAEKAAFSPLYKFHKTFEIIGNIYENPELIRGKG